MFLLILFVGVIVGSVLDDALLSPYIENKKVLYCLLNSVAYLLIYYAKGLCVEALIYAFVSSILLLISIIDYHFYEIPVKFNYALLIMGSVYAVIDHQNMADYFAGFLYISIFLCILFLASDGRLMGGGDVKLMSTCGLLLGTERILYAFYIGCVLALIVHTFQMLRKKKGRKVAMGPYFSAGIFITILFL